MAPRKPAAARSRPLPLTSLNHVSIHCSNVEQSVNFYCDVMGFVPVRRPDCLNFDGAWLFNHGIGIHLLGQSEDPHAPQLRVPKEINPKSDHFSFQCDDIEEVESGLEERGIPFLRQCVEEAGIMVEQLFFHDPDGHMIEVCNCDLLPVVPLQADPDMPLTLPACVRRKPQACGRQVLEKGQQESCGHSSDDSGSESGCDEGKEREGCEGSGADEGLTSSAHAYRIHVGLRLPPAMHPSAFTALSRREVDPAEQRYLLVGSAAGAITAFDTAAPTAVDAFAHPCHPPLFTLPRAPSSDSAASAIAARALADASAASAAGVAHSLAVTGVAWYPVDPGLFLSGSLDGLVKLWDTNTLQ
ncbi:unnamed protein product, partial [Closterium sp. NIES-64]